MTLVSTERRILITGISALLYIKSDRPNKDKLPMIIISINKWLDSSAKMNDLDRIVNVALTNANTKSRWLAPCQTAKMPNSRRIGKLSMNTLKCFHLIFVVSL